jgi:hypothetical protein
VNLERFVEVHLIPIAISLMAGALLAGAAIGVLANR